MVLVSLFPMSWCSAIVTLVLGRGLSYETSCILPFHYRLIEEVVFLGQWSNNSELLIAFHWVGLRGIKNMSACFSFVLFLHLHNQR